MCRYVYCANTCADTHLHCMHTNAHKEKLPNYVYTHIFTIFLYISNKMLVVIYKVKQIWDLTADL